MNLAHTHINTPPRHSEGLNGDSQFTSPWDPMHNDMDIVVLAGYGTLNATEKWTYALIMSLVRAGVERITIQRLTDIQGHSRRTTWNAIRSLQDARLIVIDDVGEIALIEPDARNEDFVQAIVIPEIKENQHHVKRNKHHSR
ncbi:MAG: hypothetical protein H8E26_09120 [FCB group bacterium]|nr:hypothetical protein [FCB group bacterium]MBL7028961.1 hypothetical protein [Candidatus Neomarinimicrobiota bacterium]MBL7121981.1 hypothetical protein [Candidatus Neomarinimicrobiota bacterium]